MRLSQMLSVTLVLGLAALRPAPLAAQGSRRVQPAGAQSSRRVALVVGNAAYPASPLRNSVHDAESLASTLRQLGFEVQTATDADLRALNAAVDTFVKSIRAGDVALFYYSGHGVQVEGENYLVPVDFHAEQEADVPYQAYPAGRVLDRIQGASAALSILVLDACRDNPFRATRSGTKGLATMATGKGSFIAFATSPGSTASDNAGETNGLFTKHLLSALGQADLKLDDIFNQVRERVYEESGRKQLPWTASSVIGTFVFRSLEEQTRLAAEERARLEQELKELDRQVADAVQRKAEREQADKEREAAVVRERLKFEQAEQERLRQEADQRKTQDAAGEQARRRQAETASLEELRRKRTEEETKLQGLSRDAMTLEQARRRVTSLEGSVEEIRKRIEGAQQEAIRQLDAGYAPQRAATTAERGLFETTEQYQSRLAAQKTAQEALERKYQAEKSDIEKRYAGELDLESQDYRKQVADLRAATYPLPGVRMEFVSYDADRSLLTLRLDGEETHFTVPPAKAESLYRQLSLARLESGFGSERVVVDPGSGERFTGHGLPKAGEVSVNPKDGLKYVWIPPGTFTMGCSPGDTECSGDEKPAHEVTITEGFWMGQTDVTQEAYQRVTGKSPSNFKGAKLPVETISWNEAQSYCGVVGMRLPTEAEWEYAARAGSTGARYGDLDRVAWHSANSGGKTHEVGQKEPNAFGLYDMLGNVWQWVADWYAEYTGGSQRDPAGPSTGQSRALRGGSWVGNPRDVRASYRDRGVPEFRYYVIGVRCAGN